MTRSETAKQIGHLVLADGKVFQGSLFGARRLSIGEAVFTTGMTGYQEVLTDPSYCGQTVTMTAPQIGNTGTNTEDNEATHPWVSGFVVHELSATVSNWRSNETLDAYLLRHDVPAISGIDTRELTRHLRTHGAQMAAFGAADPAELLALAKAAPSMAGQDLTQKVSTTRSYDWNTTRGQWQSHGQKPHETKGDALHVVAIDFGVKQNILRHIADLGMRVTVVPGTTSAKEILAQKPDGVFLSNGPGDPDAVKHGIATIRALLDSKTPLFGICLGHQMLAIALGGKTFKMKFGHRGLNHPVKDLTTGRVEITTQNHGFAVDAQSLEGKCTVTHVHLNDGTCMGIEHAETGAFSVQYHPEAGAGPHDAEYLFQRFADRISSHKKRIH